MTEQEKPGAETHSSQVSLQLPLFELDPVQYGIPGQPPVSSSGNQHAVSSPFSKYIVYVDESGDHSLQSIDEKYPLFVLAFCVFHKRHYSERVVPALEKLKFNHFGHDQVILHETDIRKERGAFNVFRNRAQKFQFINELTDIVEQSNFIGLFVCHT